MSWEKTHGDELGCVQGLAQVFVVHVAVVLEVGRQVLFGVAPAGGAVDVDLPAAQRVLHRDQHAQLVGDPLDHTIAVHHRLPPAVRDHADDRHLVDAAVVADVAWHVGVAAQQVQGVHHRPVGGVVALELDRGQQLGQHPPVVAGVRASAPVASSSSAAVESADRHPVTRSQNARSNRARQPRTMRSGPPGGSIFSVV
ncbi:hypothetical protein [Streptosporangium minutum]|uniref:hypothetical protein n=1 Tax=Streptosporangium minutum TaxID=569862 RepID=UPI001F614484|nr:hypothetical protein [Streptosporangium minutum]